MHLRFLLTLFSFLFLTEGNPGGKEGDPPEKKDPPEPKPDEVTFDEKQQAKINDWLAKERKDAEERTATRLAQEQADAKAKADADAKRKADEERGAFDEVKQSLESERDTAVSERDTLKETNEALLALVKADVDATWKDIPDEVKELYDGADDDVLAKKKHLTRSAKLIETLTGKQTPRGNGANPPPGTKELNIIDEATKARQRGGYRL